MDDTAGWARGQERSSIQEPCRASQSLRTTQPHDALSSDDLAALDELAAWCDRYSPLVGRELNDADAVLWLDVTGVGRLFGGDEKLAAEVERGLAEQGYASRSAVAPTVGAAWAAARFTPCRLAPEGPAIAWLRELPIEALRLAPPARALLHKLGIESIEQLLRLPRAGLAMRLARVEAGQSFDDPGRDALLRLDQATGEIDEPIVPYRPPPKFCAEMIFEHPLESRPALAAAARLVLERLTASLHAAGQGAVQLVCRFDGADERHGVRPLQAGAALFEPTACFEHLYELLEMQLEQLALRGPIGRMRIEAPLAAPLVERQAKLLAIGPDVSENRRLLARTIDRLSGKLGRENVLGARLEPDAQPERAYVCFPLAGARPERISRPEVQLKPDEEARPAIGCCQRPLVLLNPPIALQATSLATHDAIHHPPAQFIYRGRSRRTVRFWGPERIETGWWRGPSVRRDYFRVEIDSGHWCWLFRDLATGRWFLHGLFE